MSALTPDYDADPDRFLSNERWPHDDVHPEVAARFHQAGAQRVLDVGGGNGNLARLLPALSMSCLLIDLSPSMLALAPRPAVRADGARLPVADACVDAVAALYTLYHYDDPVEPIKEARRVLRPGGLFAACSPSRDSTPELAGVLPDWGAFSTFDAEDSPAIVGSAFSGPGDQVEVEKWDAPMHTLANLDYAAAFLRSMGMSEQAAQAAAAGLDLPLTLTMRGCFVYATKGRA
jgi:SAM-dependent methyltransferase